MSLRVFLLMCLAASGVAASGASAQTAVIPDSLYILIDRSGGYDEDEALPPAPVLRRMIFAPEAPVPERPAEASGESVNASRQESPEAVVALSAPLAPLAAPVYQPRALTEMEQKLARSAWAYIQRETVEETGLVLPVSGYPFATMWDIGSNIGALVSAHGLGMIDSTDFDARIGKILSTLRTMPLYNDELPNREIDVRDAGMVAIGGRKDGIGSGWSALDLGRLAIWLDLLRTHHPRWAPEAHAVVSRWRTDRLVHNGEMWGVYRTSRGERYRQEGRTGYEEYAATGLVKWGIVPDVALALEHTRTVTVEGIDFQADARGHAFLTSDPFVYAAMEMGQVGEGFEDLAESIWAVQVERWRRTGEVGVYAEDATDAQPWFAYHNLVFEDTPFFATTGREKPVGDAPTFSAKGGLAYAVLYPDSPFAAAILTELEGLATPRGLHAGRYADGRPNRSLNANTNAVALTALWFASRGGRPLAR